MRAVTYVSCIFGFVQLFAKAANPLLPSFIHMCTGYLHVHPSTSIYASVCFYLNSCLNNLSHIVYKEHIFVLCMCVFNCRWELSLWRLTGRGGGAFKVFLVPRDYVQSCFQFTIGRWVAGWRCLQGSKQAGAHITSLQMPFFSSPALSLSSYSQPFLLLSCSPHLLPILPLLLSSHLLAVSFISSWLLCFCSCMFLLHSLSFFHTSSLLCHHCQFVWFPFAFITSIRWTTIWFIATERVSLFFNCSTFTLYHIIYLFIFFHI